MRSLVVYESVRGGTAEVARAVGEGLLGHGEVTVADVRGARPQYVERFDVLVVAVPGGTWVPPRAVPAAHLRHLHHRSAGAEIGVREWLRLLPEGSHAEPVAVFDTRVVGHHVSGSGAGRAAHLLRRRGYLVVDEPATFHIREPEGRLLPGEHARAVAWGDRLGTLARQARLTLHPGGGQGTRAVAGGSGRN